MMYSEPTGKQLFLNIYFNYYKGGMDGNLGRKYLDALVEYQRGQGLTPNGIWDDTVEKYAEANTKAINKLLRENGYNVPIDMAFSRNWQSTYMTAFQKDRGIPTHGLVDKRTFAELQNKDFVYKETTAKQLFLNIYFNYYKGNMDNIFGRKSLDALVDYQRGQSLTPDGIWDKTVDDYAMENTKAINRLLRKNGYNVPEDMRFSRNWQSTYMTAFQHDKGIPTHGIVDSLTFAVLQGQSVAPYKIKLALDSFSDPYNQGYKGMCQAFVQTIYHNAGLNSPTYCCASNNRDHNAQSGSPQNGDMVYSSPNYHNAVDDVCGRYAGHVGIYYDGYVYGSQVPYKMTYNTWTSIYGYGGHSNQGNW